MASSLSNSPLQKHSYAPVWSQLTLTYPNFPQLPHFYCLAIDVDVARPSIFATVELQKVGTFSLSHSCSKVSKALETKLKLILEGQKLYFAVIKALIGELGLLFCYYSEFRGTPDILKASHVSNRVEGQQVTVTPPQLNLSSYIKAFQLLSRRRGDSPFPPFSASCPSELSSSKVWMASLVFLILWKSLQNPMHPQRNKLSHLFFCRLSYTWQAILASIPNPKQLQNPRSSCFSFVDTSLLSRMWMISPSQYVLIDECHKSNQDYSASSHYSNLSFSCDKSREEKLIGDPPHPRHLEKSLPVPIGIMQKVILFRSIPYQPIIETTHTTVPSPPQIIAVALPLLPLSILANTFLIFSSPSAFCSALNKSIKCKQIVVFFPYQKASFLFLTVRYFLPTPPPLLLLMKRKNDIFSTFSLLSISIKQYCQSYPSVQLDLTNSPMIVCITHKKISASH